MLLPLQCYSSDSRIRCFNSHVRFARQIQSRGQETTFQHVLRNFVIPPHAPPPLLPGSLDEMLAKELICGAASIKNIDLFLAKICLVRVD